MKTQLLALLLCACTPLVYADGPVATPENSDTTRGFFSPFHCPPFPCPQPCPPCVPQCPKIVCPQPCPPCNPCIPTDVISGCFFAGTSVETPVLSQIGNRFVVTFNPSGDIFGLGTYTVSLVAPGCSLVVPIVASSNPIMQPILIGSTNTSFTVGNIFPGELVCFLASSLT
jgi:hypothetical protein